MDYIVKQQPAEETRIVLSPMPTRFELFTTEIVKDVNDVDVTIPKPMGWYTLEQLENEKAMLLERISDIDSKITAINNMIEK